MFLVEDFPDWSFSSFSAYEEHLQGTFPKGSVTQSEPFPKKLETPRFGKPPVCLLQLTAPSVPLMEALCNCLIVGHSHQALNAWVYGRHRHNKFPCPHRAQNPSLSAWERCCQTQENYSWTAHCEPTRESLTDIFGVMSPQLCHVSRSLGSSTFETRLTEQASPEHDGMGNRRLLGRCWSIILINTPSRSRVALFWGILGH